MELLIAKMKNIHLWLNKITTLHIYLINVSLKCISSLFERSTNLLSMSIKVKKIIKRQKICASWHFFYSEDSKPLFDTKASTHAWNVLK